MTYLLLAIAFCAGGFVGSLRVWDRMTDAKRYREALLSIAGPPTQHACNGPPGCSRCTALWALHPSDG